MTALLASGRDADVYALDERRVLRRYRRGGDVTAEVTVMRYVADHGYPVPRVYEADGADLILERLDGPTMLQALGDGTMHLRDGGVVLADLLDRLHRIRVRSATDPGTRILHLDLHPENVVMTEGGPVVIDWRNSIEGPPELDVAMTAIIIAQVAVKPDHPFTDRAEEFLDVLLSCTRDNPLSQLEAAVRRRATEPHLTDDELAHIHEAKLLVTTIARAHH
ncbi:phosphotransferase [Dactylosporangium fulvum]|uniref:Phosphotransferase n=1 Tax=Dactylosporangium fulvum TaxID=53359 RepID=A0ABY5VXH1_9ACTN|nr:phosphotransferase [Dactylosporangium fulvum]UWP81754.1 phosphotransferase [Dactylosporangium fulvum]